VNEGAMAHWGCGARRNKEEEEEEKKVMEYAKYHKK
jgi:hypothetical protein